MESWNTVHLNSWVWAGANKPLVKRRPAAQLRSLMKHLVTLQKQKKNLLQHEQGSVSPEEEFDLSWSFIFF